MNEQDQQRALTVRERYEREGKWPQTGDVLGVVTEIDGALFCPVREIVRWDDRGRLCGFDFRDLPEGVDDMSDYGKVFHCGGHLWKREGFYVRLADGGPVTQGAAARSHRAR